MILRFNKDNLKKHIANKYPSFSSITPDDTEIFIEYTGRSISPARYYDHHLFIRGYTPDGEKLIRRRFIRSYDYEI